MGDGRLFGGDGFQAFAFTRPEPGHTTKTSAMALLAERKRVCRTLFSDVCGHSEASWLVNGESVSLGDSAEVGIGSLWLGG